MTRVGVDAMPLSSRGTTTCRGCHADVLASVLDLGVQPLANELLLSAQLPDALFPLHLRICVSCGLGQVGEFAPRERIFGADYPYLSSVSTSWLAHARRYAVSMQRELGLSASSLVVEVASNDGYLLRHFRDLNVPVLGIEPAESVASLARASGIETLSRFFGFETAQHIVDHYGRPRLVAANNVMAHVPDLDDFVSGLALLCDDETVITVENPSFVTLLNETQFDTIYHEHFSYLSAHSVKELVGRHGLELIRVEELPTHGGSYRYWIVRKDRRAVDGSVRSAIERELTADLFSQELWSNFARRSRLTIDGLSAWLHERAAIGARVAAYGAAAKGNTLLNAARATAANIVLVADGSREKQGKFLPGSRIPVVPPVELASAEPTDVLILPWNIANELEPIIAQLTPQARRWIAVPAMNELVA